jgi:hypothetical protein
MEKRGRKIECGIVVALLCASAYGCAAETVEPEPASSAAEPAGAAGAGDVGVVEQPLGSELQPGQSWTSVTLYTGCATGGGTDAYLETRWHIAGKAWSNWGPIGGTVADFEKCTTKYFPQGIALYSNERVDYIDFRRDNSGPGPAWSLPLVKIGTRNFRSPDPDGWVAEIPAWTRYAPVLQ